MPPRSTRSEIVAPNLNQSAILLYRRLLHLLAPFLVLIAICAAIPDSVAADQPTVIGLRFGANETVTRVVIDIDRPLRFAAGVLLDPPRLVVDLERVTWRVRESAEGRPRGLATVARYGNVDDRASRLVIEIDRPFRIVRQDLMPPSGQIRHYRLLLDLAAAPSATTPAAARTPSTVRPPLPRPEAELLAAEAAAGFPATIEPAAAPRKRVIVLDPGHGGIDPGATGINGVHEKAITLEVAHRLRHMLEDSDRYEVVLTRTSDAFVPLRERMDIARRAGAELFISIHADSIANERTRGASVYTLSDTASDAEAARLAAKENKADIISGTDLSGHDEIVASILIDLAQRDTNNKSIDFADILTAELAGSTDVLRNTRRFAGFVVLKSPDIPSVLLELGYLSNPSDAQNLARPDHQDSLAKATLRAIDRYFAPSDATL